MGLDKSGSGIMGLAISGVEIIAILMSGSGIMGLNLFHLCDLVGIVEQLCFESG